MTYVLIPMMIAAPIIANLLTNHDPQWAIVNALWLIPIDLVARDRLDDTYRGAKRVAIMVGVVATASLLTYAINPAAQAIAAASATAFALSFLTDWGVYSRLRRFDWLTRSNGSNIPSALIDSIAFPAFAALYGFPGLWDWFIVTGLFGAKVGGGVIWSFILRPHMDAMARRHAAEAQAMREADEALA
jgi:hypothetical protein